MHPKKPTTRIGITMRVVSAKAYSESRDALSQDWSNFMAFALPEIIWLPIPNLGIGSTSFAQEWALDGLILSGGDDLGKTPKRDLTEKNLLEYFMNQELPVFGVCRGLQYMQSYFKGRIRADESNNHVRLRHPVKIICNIDNIRSAGTEHLTNSFHDNIINVKDVPDPLVPFAISADGTVEGIICRDFSLLAIMWHPERESPFQIFDRKLMRWCFGLDC